MSPVAPNDRRGVVSRLGPQTEPLSAAEVTRTPEEPPAVGGTNELDPEDETAATGGGVEIEPGAPLPLTGAPGGTAFGTLVHTVLERLDFAMPDLRDELRSACAEALRHRRVAVAANDLADALLPALDGPLLYLERYRDLEARLADEAALRAAIERRVVRASGLGARPWPTPGP